MIRTRVVENDYAVRIEVLGNDTYVLDMAKRAFSEEFKPFVKKTDAADLGGFWMLFDLHADAHACMIRPNAARLRGIVMGIMHVQSGNLKNYSEEE